MEGDEGGGRGRGRGGELPVAAILTTTLFSWCARRGTSTGITPLSTTTCGGREGEREREGGSREGREGGRGGGREGGREGRREGGKEGRREEGKECEGRRVKEGRE